MYTHDSVSQVGRQRSAKNQSQPRATFTCYLRVCPWSRQHQLLQAAVPWMHYFIKSTRHNGHRSWFRIHSTTQSSWNTWLHSLVTAAQIVSPGWYSSKHIQHSSFFDDDGRLWDAIQNPENGVANPPVFTRSCPAFRRRLADVVLLLSKRTVWKWNLVRICSYLVVDVSEWWLEWFTSVEELLVLSVNAAPSASCCIRRRSDIIRRAECNSESMRRLVSDILKIMTQHSINASPDPKSVAKMAANSMVKKRIEQVRP